MRNKVKIMIFAVVKKINSKKFMIYFTKYAEQKFEILNKHKVYFTKEQIKNCLNLPDKINKKGEYTTSRKDNIKIVYKKEMDIIKIITFYPVKS